MKEHINTAIIALSIVITGYLVSQAWQYRYTNEERIRVKGLGSKDFNADLIVLYDNFIKRIKSIFSFIFIYSVFFCNIRNRLHLGQFQIYLA